MKKVLAVAAAAVLCAGVLGGCSSDATETQSIEKIKEAGKITMYTDAAFPPFEYTEGSNVMGVDVEIGLEIAKDLGVELEVKNVKFDTIVAGIQTGKAAFGAAGITVTEERKEAVDFSQEYYTSVQYIVCKEGDTYSSLSDLAGKKIGVQLGTTGDFLASDAVNGTEDEETKEHVKGALEDTGASVSQYANAIDAAQDMMNGKVDVVIIDKLPAESIVNNNTGLKCVEIADAEPESYGICVAKGNEELLAAINKTLDRLKEEGKIDQYVLAHSEA